MHGRSSLKRPSSTLIGQSGSAISARPSSTRSASPSATTFAASSGSSSRPTAITGTFTARLTAAAYSTMCPRGTNIGASVTCSVCQVPAETLIAATPASSSHCETSTVSSIVSPPGMPSSPLIRQTSGRSTVAMIARATSRLNRARFSRLPP